MADTVAARRATDVAAAVDALARLRIWALAYAAMILVLMAPALWNRFPIIFPDTGGYLTRPIEGTLAMGRSAFYGVFLYITVPLALWPAIIMQTALTAWVIVLTLRALGLGRPWVALAVVALLSAFTSLAWIAVQLIPDILFPLAVLSISLLLFRAATLARWERIGLCALIAATIASHMAALGLCVGLIGSLWLLSRIRIVGLPPLRLLPASTAAGLGVVLCLVSNLAVTGNFAFTPGGASFVFARLIDDGIVGRYVHDVCPDPSLRLCQYKSALPADADEWLWGPNSAFYKLGGSERFGPEAQRIVLDSIRRYPWMHVTTAAGDIVEQLTSFATEVSMSDNGPTIDTVRDHAPQLLDALNSARQQAQPFDVGTLNMIHVPVAAFAMVVLAAVVLFRRRAKLAPPLFALGLTVLLALAGNAVICAIFSHAVDRYQSRLVPLASLVLIAAAARAYGLGDRRDLT